MVNCYIYFVFFLHGLVTEKEERLMLPRHENILIMIFICFRNNLLSLYKGKNKHLTPRNKKSNASLIVSSNQFTWVDFSGLNNNDSTSPFNSHEAYFNIKSIKHF